MRLLRRLFKIPTHIMRIQIEGEPVKDLTVEYWMSLASIFNKAPGLHASLLADFRDVMESIEKLPADAHGERLRLSQKACDLWRFLNIPHASVTQANALLELQKDEREEKTIQATGPKTVM